MQRPTRLFNRHFTLLWQGQFVSNIGNQMFIIALIFWVKDVYNSASLIGLLLLVAGLPQVIFGPIGGAFADRYSRRNIILLSDLISGVAMLSVVGLMLLLPAATDIILGWIFLVTILVTTAGAFFQPAIDAAVPDLVPENKVASANSLNEFSLNLAVLLGQGLGGVLFRFLGAPMLFLINSLTFLFSATSEAFITIPQQLPERSERWQDRMREFGNDILAGLRYIWGIAGLRKFILLLTFVNFMGMPVIVLLPFYVEDVLHLTADWYGFFIAAFSAGMLVGYICAGTLNLSGNRRGQLTLTSVLLQGVVYLLIVLLGNRWATLGLTPVAGAMSGFMTVNITTILQITTPSDLRGRVFGLLGTILSSISPIAAGLAGIVADLLDRNIPLIYLVCSIAIIVVTASMALSRDIRAFLAQEEATRPAVEPQGAAVVFE